MRKLIIILLACCLWPSAALAVERSVLRDAARESVKELEFKASEGDVNAQFYLGKVYYWNTYVVKQNVVKGLEFFRMAAEQDHVEACSRLADIYIKGDSCGTPKM